MFHLLKRFSTEDKHLKKLETAKNNFPLKLNLQRISMVSIGAKFWDNPDAKKVIINYYKIEKTKRIICELENIAVFVFNEIAKYSSGDGRQNSWMKLPHLLLTELRNTIVGMGERIHYWLCRFNGILKNLKSSPEIFFVPEKIFWTHYGTVDEIKIFRFYWDKDADFDGDNSSLACIYTQIEIIQRHREKVTEEINSDFIIDSELYCKMVESIRSESERVFPEDLEVDILIVKCLQEGCNHAFKFFWSRLEESQRVLNIYDLAEFVLRFETQIGNLYLAEKHCESFVFLVNQMEQNSRRTFFQGNDVQIILKFLPVSPYGELILDFFDTLDISDPTKLLYAIMNIKTKHTMSLEAEKTRYEVFRLFWGKVRACDKIYFLLCNMSKLFYEWFDPSILNFIVKDESVDYNVQYIHQPYRKPPNDDRMWKDWLELIHSISLENIIKFIETRNNKNKLTDAIIHYGFTKLAESEEFDKIFQITQALHSDKVKVSIAGLNASILDHFIENGQFYFAGKFLEWASEESEALKKIIDMPSYCQTLVTFGEFSIADQFLNWFSDSPEDRNIIKSQIDSASVFLEMITSLDLELAVEFLKWRFQTENDVEDFTNGLDRKFSADEDFNCKVDLTVKLFKFSVSSEERKQNMRDVVEKWLDYYVTERQNLEKAEVLLDRLYDTAEEKKEVIKKFLNSSGKGALMCAAYLSEDEIDISPCQLTRLLNWLKLVNNLEELRSDLFAIMDLPEWFIITLEKFSNSNRDVISCVGFLSTHYF